VKKRNDKIIKELEKFMNESEAKEETEGRILMEYVSLYLYICIGMHAF